MAGRASLGQIADRGKVGLPAMTPMIDVVFLLLVFFMVGMQIRNPEGILKTFLPRGGDGPGEFPTNDLTIRLQKNLAESTKKKPVVEIFFEQYRCRDLDDLRNRLCLLSEEISEIPIVIDGGPNVPFEYILGSLDACKQAKFTNILFEKPPPDLD